MARAEGIPTDSRIADEATTRSSARSLALEVAALILAALILLVSVLPHLADHPTLTDDEAWVMSASYKLARDGVFGSDIFEGFFNADRRYFFNMPGHHFVVAAVFKVVGAGIAEARLAGAGYGLATLLLTYLLTRRLYGITAAVLSLALLLFLRFSMGVDTGLPLQELAANLRYDLAPVPFMLGGVLVLLGPASLRRAAIAGALFAVATLMQFYGAFMFPIAIAFLLWDRGSDLSPSFPLLRQAQDAVSVHGEGEVGMRQRATSAANPLGERGKLIGALLGVAALVALPYAAYVALNLEDFRGQAGTIDRRASITEPRFYIDNLIDEPDRFVQPLAIPFAFEEVPEGEDVITGQASRAGIEALPRRPSAKLAVFVGLPLALVFAGRRALKLGSRGDRMLFLCLAGLVAQYALLESTKFYFYWIPVVPFLCAGLGGAVAWLLRPPREQRWRLVAAGVTALLLLAVFAEGSVARLNGLRTASAAPSYEELVSTVHGYVPEGSRVVGSTALWWGLRDTDYRSYFLFFYVTRDDAGEFKRTITAFLNEFDPQYIALTRRDQAQLQRFLSPRDYADWQSFLATRAQKVTRIEGDAARGYAYVDIWRVP